MDDQQFQSGQSKKTEKSGSGRSASEAPLPMESGRRSNGSHRTAILPKEQFRSLDQFSSSTHPGSRPDDDFQEASSILDGADGFGGALWDAEMGLI